MRGAYRVCRERDEESDILVSAGVDGVVVGKAL